MRVVRRAMDEGENQLTVPTRYGLVFGGIDF